VVKSITFFEIFRSSHKNCRDRSLIDERHSHTRKLGSVGIWIHIHPAHAAEPQPKDKSTIHRRGAGREKKSVHASRTSARTVWRHWQFSHLAVRPEHVEGRAAIFSHDHRVRGAFIFKLPPPRLQRGEPSESFAALGPSWQACVFVALFSSL
jgi:hypothetical protein